jgi:hypothetical protein
MGFGSFLRNLLFDEPPYRSVLIQMDSELYHLVQSMVVIQNTQLKEEEDPIIFDDIVNVALIKHVKKNLWSTKDDGNVTKIDRIKLDVNQVRDSNGKFTSGQRQSK